MLPLEHSAILLTYIKQLLVLKTYFGLLFEWPLKTGFTVLINGIPQVDWMQLGRSVVHRNIQHDTGLYEPFFRSIKHVGLAGENLSSGFATNKGADQPAHPHRLISAFVIPFLKSIISKLASCEIFIF